MQLSWQPGFTQSRKPLKKPNQRRVRRLTSGDRGRPRHFEFVVEHPHGNPRLDSEAPPSTRNGSCESLLTSTASQQPSTRSNVAVSDLNSDLGNGRFGGPLDACQLFHDNGFAETLFQASSEESLLGTSELQHQDTSQGPPDLPYGLHLNQGQLPMPLSPLGPTYQRYAPRDNSIGSGDMLDEQSGDLAVVVLQDIPPLTRLARTSGYFPTTILPNVLYSNLSQKYQPILERYDKEFCKIPITSELYSNPFQCQVNPDSAPLFPAHAVMALAGHHVGSMTAESHRYAALQSLRYSLSGENLPNISHSLLNTIIILFSFDEAQSAFGNWKIHLAGAYGLLEACGGIKVWLQSTTSTVQVGMLLWWDAILSLLSREDRVFPDEYFEALVSCYDGQDWDYFGLCGCPFSLVKVVMQLARLVAEKRKSSAMRYVNFDDSHISEVACALESWQYSPAAITATSRTIAIDEDFVQRDRDAMHCCEAWRKGLLLYLYRVFRWQPGDNIPMNILYNARAVMDHVTACRDESMVSRQALLPLFFAGCEMRDQSSRTKILKICTFWDNETRYHIFGSAIPLLKEVWAKQRTDGFANVWWGQIVDQQHASNPDNSLQVQLCFG